MKTLFFVLSFFIFHSTHAGTVDTVMIPSKSMKKTFKAVLIRPDTYKKGKGSYPVVYLLHGYAGKYSDWIGKMKELPALADQFQVIILCPDGHYSSWYFDSPIDSTMRYESYIGTEVPEWMDRNYRTIKTRKGRAITGLSMGGHGSMFLGLKHHETFGAIGSMSGGFDLYASRQKFDIIKRIGDTITNRQNWIDYSVLGLIEKFKGHTASRIIIDCGVDDFFFPSNRAVHERMIALNIPHEYIERPGNHSWNYWMNSLRYQLYFFWNYFNEKSS